MNKADRARVIQGLVRHELGWITIEQKAELEAETHKRLREGYVKCQGEWMTIDEKLRRSPAAQPLTREPPPPNIYYNPTYNQQTYNIQNTDARSFTQNVGDHRHVHVDPAALPPNMAGQQLPPGYIPQQAMPGTPPPGQVPQQDQRLIEQTPQQELPKDAPEYFYGEQGEEEEPTS